MGKSYGGVGTDGVCICPRTEAKDGKSQDGSVLVLSSNKSNPRPILSVLSACRPLTPV